MGSLQVDVFGEACSVTTIVDKTLNEAADAVVIQHLFNLANDDQGLSVTIRSDGCAQGKISALVFEPVEDDSGAAFRESCIESSERLIG